MPLQSRVQSSFITENRYKVYGNSLMSECRNSYQYDCCPWTLYNPIQWAKCVAKPAPEQMNGKNEWILYHDVSIEGDIL